MSDLMREFLKLYLEWAELNASSKACLWRPAKPLDNGLNFDMEFGLCSNIHVFVEWKQRGSYWLLRSQCSADMERELKELFARSGLSVSYPFGFESYDKGYRCGNHHTDPNRLAWIRSQLEATPNV